jgi:hypothetical protein
MITTYFSSNFFARTYPDINADYAAAASPAKSLKVVKAGAAFTFALATAATDQWLAYLAWNPML